MQLLWEGISEAIRLLGSFDPLVYQAAWRSLWISCTAVGIGGALGIAIGSVLARRRFFGSRVLTLVFRAAMGLPTVFVGLACYAIFSRKGILGPLDLLYSPWGIVIGEICLALPIVTTWTVSSLLALDARAFETAQTLGVSTSRRWFTYLSECRLGITLAILTAFARCVTELGIAMLVGGNLKHQTRTLATATALETARGEFGRGVAMSLILLIIAMIMTAIVGWLSQPAEDGE